MIKTPEIQDILIQYWGEFKKKYPVPYNANKVVRDLINCRTSALGGHIDECEDCGHIKISYNSCRNRHCPKCQGLKRERWALKQQANMLNEKYFHVVFTLPEELNPIALKNQRVFYSLLFKAASETLKQLAQDKKHLGAQIGITSVLHTWGQTLSFHPHLHCIIPAGGLSPNNINGLSLKRIFLCTIKCWLINLEVNSLIFLKRRFPLEILSFMVALII